MKILTYNVRGLGSSVKKKELKEIINKHKIELCCVQETKLESISELECKAVWGDDKFGWDYREAEGRAGGILSIWDSEVFSCLSSWHMNGALIVNGFWGQECVQCCIINVYAPCLLSEKEGLWDRLNCVISQSGFSCLCVTGDFNSIRRESEREGRGMVINNRDIRSFDEFIRSSNLIDLPLHGRQNESCKSRLNRLIISGLLDGRIRSRRACPEQFLTIAH